MWGIVTKKIGRVAVKEQGKCDTLLFTRSLMFFLPAICKLAAFLAQSK